MGELTAEIRWWGSGEVPVPVRRWFEAGSVSPGGGGERTDRYIATGSRQIGVKYRDGTGGLEIKSRIDERPLAAFAGGKTTVGLWIKQATDLCFDAPTIAVTKQRLARLFDCTEESPSEIALGRDEAPIVNGSPPQGCTIELARITRKADIWWSVCFEAYGTLDRVAGNLASTIDMVAPLPDALADARQASYPEWLVESD